MSALSPSSRRLLSAAFPTGGAYVVTGRYDKDDTLRPGREGPAGTFDLPDDMDLYYCVAAIPAGKDRKDAGRVMVLVIDDVGKEIDRQGFDMLFPLQPSFTVESSAGSFQYGFIIEGGMEPAEYKALRLAMRGNALWGGAHNTGAAGIFRLPQGTHTKSSRGGWKARDGLWTGVTHRVGEMWTKLAPAGAPRLPGRGSAGDLVEDEALLAELVGLIPNAVADWDGFVNVGRAIWGASEGKAVGVDHQWAAKYGGNVTEVTQARWDSFRDANIGRFWLLRAARSADPAGAEAWVAKEAASVFDDGEVPPAPGVATGGLPRAMQLRYAEEIARRWGWRMRYVLDRKAWAEFDGVAWRHLPSKVKLAGRAAMAMARSAPPKARGEHDVTTLSFLDGVEGLCQQMPALQCRETDFDKDVWLLGTPGGTVDLRTGVLVPAKASDLISKVTAVAPAAAVVCPRWLKFLDEVTEKDLASVAFLQQWAGYCLTGLTIEEKILFLYGPGGNGKSKFADMLAWAMGDYAAKPVADLFIKKAHGMGHTSKLAMLSGARLCTISEVPAGAQWDEGLLKDITGGGVVTAGFKHKDEFSFEPRFKLLAYGNHQPTFPGGIDEAIRRRFMMMEFRFQPKVVDLELMDKLKGEAAGVLRWMIDGCLAWRKTRLIKPKKVEDATDAMFREQDLLGQWIGARIEKARGSEVLVLVLFKDWIDWRNQQGNHELFDSVTVFGKELVDRRGFARKRINSGNVYQDIKIRGNSGAGFDVFGNPLSP
jgi:putative DNA primase/helicase